MRSNRPHDLFRQPGQTGLLRWNRSASGSACFLTAMLFAVLLTGCAPAPPPEPFAAADAEPYWKAVISANSAKLLRFHTFNKEQCVKKPEAGEGVFLMTYRLTVDVLDDCAYDPATLRARPLQKDGVPAEGEQKGVKGEWTAIRGTMEFSRAANRWEVTDVNVSEFFR